MPAIVLGGGVAAVAASNTLALTTLDRSGKKVTVTALAVNLSTHSSYTVKSNKPKKLPKGSYAVFANIGDKSSTTLGVRTVKVSGTSKTTVDARKGKKVTVGLSPAPAEAGLYTQTEVEICLKAMPLSYNVQGSDFYGDLYVIPNSSKKYTFAATRAWTDRLLNPGPTQYAVMYTTAGVPSKPSRTIKQSSLATINVTARRGPSAGRDSSFVAQPADRSCGNGFYQQLVSADQPYRTKVKVTAGKWDFQADSSGTAKDGSSYGLGGLTATRKVVAGKSYGLNFYRSAWGPSARLPVVLNGRISYLLEEMFADPGFPMKNAEGGDKATATLSFGGKIVKTVKDKGWEPYGKELEYRVKKAGWYKLTNDASRYYPEITFPAGMLSTKASVTYRFKAKPNTYATVPVYAITMLPTGLSLHNRAKPASTTNVQLKLSRTKWEADSTLGKNPKIKSVGAKASFDGGKTWRSVKVKKVSGVWTAQVPNPASGAVSLRARVTDTTGGYTDVTIYRAYAIG
ncbi:hypothetical protein C1I93_01520 [Micromonospora endophytica]|uniref:Uncharacterized protein n=1 Tax=Micromonospora endophytica TaxID=515350 RepID=A0A2W2DA75_9ACTN|nr:hypothetical protein C1I93_01520 [Micromonospora endophytica]RIW42056.1 hypothetical protein D3H59_24140 [Micromonospora endophytica]